jgi:NAD(P)-dependent dehydrogenase (short-subunit alcohol dehydrogenase family)
VTGKAAVEAQHQIVSVTTRPAERPRLRFYHGRSVSIAAVSITQLLDHVKEEGQMKKVWLVTGSASGLGRYVVEAALAAGHQVVASSRRPEDLAELVAEHGQNLRPVKHDVVNEAEARTAVEIAVKEFGRLDVVVNNAGYSKFAPFEQIEDADFKGIIDTCFYGVVYTTRAALPVMRGQRSGIIFQVSSIGGRITRPGNSPYHAAKWAVSGFSEALAQETASFGIQICALEPGGIRTNWGKRAASEIPSVLPDYEKSVGETLRRLDSYWGQENSDPKLIAQVIVELSNEKSLPAHLLLGSDAVANLERVDEQRRQAASNWRKVSTSVDYHSEDVPEAV